MKLSMSEILQKVDEASSHEDKVAVLKQNYDRKLHETLAFAYDPRITWTLPEGTPPYTPSPDTTDSKLVLFAEHRKLYLFLKGGKGDRLPAVKREKIFIDLLSTVDPEDAKLLLSLKKKEIPYASITRELVEEAWGECL